MILDCITIANLDEVKKSKEMSENLGICNEVEEEIRWSKLWVHEEDITCAYEVDDRRIGKAINIFLGEDDSFMVRDEKKLRDYLDAEFNRAVPVN
jgi:hypothetical protein